MLHYLDDCPRRLLALVCAACLALLAFGLYLQYQQGLEPCPMCIVQRYALILIAACAGLASLGGKKCWQIGWTLPAFLFAGFGAFTAARQSWLQWYPPEFASCGRDFFGMVESYPLSRAIPMIFRGSGDCAAVDWTFLGGSIANWSFLCFCALALFFGVFLLRRLRRRS